MKYQYACQVYNVVDGDTVDCVIDVGFRVNISMRVRLWGLNAAEMKTGAPGLSAQAALRLLVIGKPLVVRTLKDTQDKYGRMLGIFYEANTTRSINQKMLDQGLAVPFMVKMNGTMLPEV